MTYIYIFIFIPTFVTKINYINVGKYTSPIHGPWDRYSLCFDVFLRDVGAALLFAVKGGRWFRHPQSHPSSVYCWHGQRTYKSFRGSCIGDALFDIGVTCVPFCVCMCLFVLVRIECFCLLHGIPFWRALGFCALRRRSSMGGRRPSKIYNYEPGKYNIISSPLPIFRIGGSRREKSIFQVQCKLHIYSTFGVMQRPFVQTLRVWLAIPTWFTCFGQSFLTRLFPFLLKSSGFHWEKLVGDFWDTPGVRPSAGENILVEKTGLTSSAVAVAASHRPLAFFDIMRSCWSRRCWWLPTPM